MSLEANKRLIQRYIQAVDANDSSDWSVLDEYIAEDFVAHDPPLAGVSLDRDGMKQAAEIFRVATPGRHEIRRQVDEEDPVVSLIAGQGVHVGEFSASRNTKERRDRRHRDPPHPGGQDRRVLGNQ
jgi:SnoaL-like polyketide cyclase